MAADGPPRKRTRSRRVLPAAARLVVAQLAVERARGDAEDSGGALAVAARVFEDAEDVPPLKLVERDGERDDVETVEEVCAEAPGAHVVGEVAVGGGDDAHVRLAVARRADAAEAPLFEEAEEFDLRLLGHLADLVEEERRAVGGLDQAALRRGRAGERAALVPEEFRLEEWFGQGRAVDRDHRRVRARASRVDEAREHVLAHARLAGDDDGRVGARRRLGERHQVSHRLTPEDGRRLRVLRGRAHGVTQGGVLPDEAALLVGLADDRFDLVERGGLRQVVVSAEPHRLQPRAERGVGGEHDDFGRVFELAYLAEGVEAGEARHANVQEHHVEVVLRERVERLLAGGRRGGVEAHARDLLRQEPAQHGVVVHNHHADFSAHTGGDRGRSVGAIRWQKVWSASYHTLARGLSGKFLLLFGSAPRKPEAEARARARL